MSTEWFLQYLMWNAVIVVPIIVLYIVGKFIASILKGLESHTDEPETPSNKIGFK